MPTANSLALNTIRVLIVEDNADQAESMRRILESRSEVQFEPEVVGTLAAAETRLSRGGIDAVLLDLRLPDSGREEDVVHQIADRNPDVGIVAMTGWAGPEIAAPIKAAGADEVLIKPAEPMDVSIKLQTVVIHRRFSRQRKERERLLSEFAAQLVSLGELR